MLANFADISTWLLISLVRNEATRREEFALNSLSHENKSREIYSFVCKFFKVSPPQTTSLRSSSSVRENQFEV